MSFPQLLRHVGYTDHNYYHQATSITDQGHNVLPLKRHDSVLLEMLNAHDDVKWQALNISNGSREDSVVFHGWLELNGMRHLQICPRLRNTVMPIVPPTLQYAICQAITGMMAQWHTGTPHWHDTLAKWYALKCCRSGNGVCPMQEVHWCSDKVPQGT